MEVKEILKRNGITISEFASNMKISRPTLDSYINQFEQNHEVSKEKYDLIFKELFTNEELPQEKFLKRLEKYTALINRDDAMGVIDLDTEHTDLLSSVISRIKEDMKQEDCVEDIYVFINMLIANYRKEDVFRKLCDYFLVLNGKKEVGDLESDSEIYLSNYYKVFSNDKEGKLSLDKKYYELFIKRIDEIKLMQDKIKKDIKKKLEQELSKKIEEQVKLGIDINDIDIQNILKEISIVSD